MPINLDSAWQDSDDFSDMQADPVLPCQLAPQLKMEFDSNPAIQLEWAPSDPQLHMLSEPDLPAMHLSLDSDQGIHFEWPSHAPPQIHLEPAFGFPQLHMLSGSELPALHLSRGSGADIHFELPSHAPPQIHLEPTAGFGFPQLHMQLESSGKTDIYMHFEPSSRRLS